MTAIGAPVPGLVPMHVGLPEPAGPAAAPRARPADARPQQGASGLSGGGIDWGKHGVEPRWLGQESGDCAVALEPGIFHNGGDVERKRFVAGAAGRGETALLVSGIGDVDDRSPRNPLSTWDASVRLPLFGASLGGPRLLAGARPKLAGDLDAADRDLGMRLLNRPRDAAWWRLELRANQVYTGGGDPLPLEARIGHLHPILVDLEDAPVVAAWIPAEGNQRWYIVPDTTDWNTVIDWLVRQALPAHVPGALRRARHATFIDLGLQTAHETRARQGLADLADQYARQKAVLEDELRRAEERAAPVRNGLLYGTADDLVAAVAQVLTDAGLAVVDLDRELGATVSADLLVTGGPERRLVEVKSAGGIPAESLVDFLRKHLETWPALKPDLPVGGGALIVNHQHKLAPQERTAAVFGRKEFVDSLAYPVLSTRELFDWWRAEDWPSVHAAILGPGHPVAAPDPGSAGAPVSGAPASRPARRGWRGRRTSPGA